MLNIPANPFTRQPITKIRFLSGRAQEINELDYCFKQTSAGQSRHCAVIGPRGVGKSSLLLSSKELAPRWSLLPVNMDLNTDKVKTTYKFWKDVYISLSASAAQQGCWGGVNSAIYNDIIGSLIGTGKNHFFQLPRYWDPVDSNASSCPDGMIKQDLLAFNNELRQQGLKGTIICIDEADCLTVDLSLLQSIRSVFQNIEGVSLILAGTSELFSQMEGVFSSIPRQFHKIEVQKFLHWSETRNLIFAALGDNAESLAPDQNTIINLHRETGGDPADIQLYCVEMYKQLEEGRASKMELSTNVYRSVYQEYRKFTHDDAGQTLTRLEELSKTLIPASPWLQNSYLSSSENCDLQVAIAEFEYGQTLSIKEREAISQKVSDSYKTLYRLDITSSEDCLKINDAACLKSFWKSLVKLETGEQWNWRDEQSYGNLLLDELHNILFQKSAAAHSSSFLGMDDSIFENICGSTNEKGFKNLEPIIEALSAVKNSVNPDGSLKNIPQKTLVEQIFILYQTFECLNVLRAAIDANKTNLVRIPITFEHPTFTTSRIVTYFGSSDPNEELEQVRTFIDERKSLLETHRITPTIGKAALYVAPDFFSLNRLMEKFGIRMLMNPKYELLKAYDYFVNQRVEQSIDILSQLISIYRVPSILNNLAFCKIFLKEIGDARSLLNEALEREKDSLFLNNLAMIEYLAEEPQKTKALLLEAWALEQQKPNWNNSVLCMYVIDKSSPDNLAVWQEIPCGVGLAYSLTGLGALDMESLEKTFLEKLTSQQYEKVIDTTRISKLPLP